MNVQFLSELVEVNRVGGKYTKYFARCTLRLVSVIILTSENGISCASSRYATSNSGIPFSTNFIVFSEAMSCEKQGLVVLKISRDFL